ncbi:MAG: sulfatase-like hydrolase/transferase, partial [Planctomycetota bacterium]
MILISLDTVRADCLGVYGGPDGATPALDGLAEAADVYETCVSAAPWTMPTHASMFTGLYPFEHGAHSFLPEETSGGDNVFGLSDRIETLAEGLAARGYRTGGVASNAIYLRPMLGLEQGFLAWDVERALAKGINGRALAWLDENVDGDRPFFLFLNYMDAHRPYATGDREDLPAERLDQLIDKVMEEGEEDHALAAEVRALHQKAVARLDAGLGKLFDGLKERDLFDRSVIVVTSDHGEAFGGHGIVEHSKDLYEDVVRVPLIVKLPGQEVGRRVRERASSVHVAGLVARALAGTDAESLAAVFPRVPNGGAVFTENYYSRMKDLKRFGARFRRQRRAMYSGSMKLIVGSDGSTELYDLGADPAELTNLAESSAEAVQGMLVGLNAFFGGPTRYEGSPMIPGALTREQAGEFSAMGYGGDDDDD